MSDLERCSIERWYPALRKVTIRTTLIPLSEAFVRYLLADSVFVPNNNDSDDDGGSNHHDGSSDDGDASDWEDADHASADATARFPDIEDAID